MKHLDGTYQTINYIPGEILKLIASRQTDYIIKVYHHLAHMDLFPPQWKTARLVLIQKGNKPLDEKGSLKPLSILDNERKLVPIVIFILLINMALGKVVKQLMYLKESSQ